MVLCCVGKQLLSNDRYVLPHLILHCVQKRYLLNKKSTKKMYFLYKNKLLLFKELEPLNPIRQYLCIKFVVFATFWQSVLLAILVKFHILSPQEWPYFPTLTDTVNGLQVNQNYNFLNAL